MNDAMVAESNSLRDWILDGNEYGTWVLNTLISHFAVSMAVPLRCLRATTILNGSDILRDITKTELFTHDPSDCSDPLSVFSAISLDADEESLSRISHTLSGSLFSSAGCYSNPVFTEVRRDAAWRIAEVVALYYAASRELKADLAPSAGRSLSFTGPLSDYFSHWLKPIPSAGIFLLAGPVWKWHDLVFHQDGIGRELTAAAIRLITDAFSERYSSYSKRVEARPRVSDRGHRLRRLGNMRAAISTEDMRDRTTKISTALDLALSVEITPNNISDSSSRASLHLSSSSIGVNHWLGVGIVSSVLARRWNKSLDLSENTAFYYLPPSLGYASDRKTPRLAEYYVRADWSAGPGAWHLSLDRPQVAQKFGDQKLHRIAAIEGGRNNELFNRLGIELSRKVDRNHTNRSHYLGERILLLRHQMADSAAEMVAPAVQRKQSGPNTVYNAFGRLIADVDVHFPPSFASNIAYALGADVCCIYQYDYSRQVLNAVQMHYGPIVTSSLSAKQCAQLESDEIRSAGANIESRAYRDVYLVLPEAHENTSFGGKAVEKISRNPEDVPSALPHEVIGSSMVAVPIRISGRVWGVVEVRGRYPRQLRQSTRTWLSEIASTIGINILSPWVSHHVSTLVGQASDILREPDLANFAFDRAVAKHLVSLFLCESCFVWRNKGDDNGTVQLSDAVIMSGSFDIWSDIKGNLKELVGKPIAELLKENGSKENKSLLVHDFLESGEPFAQFTIGDRSGKWAEGALCTALAELGQRQICLLRIDDEANRAEAVIWLAGHERFESVWQSIFPSVIAQFELIFDISLGRHRLLQHRQTFISHEVLGAFTRITDEVTNLKEQREFLEPNNRKRISGLLADIKLHLIKSGGFGQLNVAGAATLFGELESHFSISPGKLDSIGDGTIKFNRSVARLIASSSQAADYIQQLMHGEQPKTTTITGTRVNLRRIIESSIDISNQQDRHLMERISDPRAASIRSFPPVWLGPKGPLKYIFPRDPAEFIFNNIIGNAVKYNIGRTGIQIEVKEIIRSRTSTITFTVSNFGWAIQHDEEELVFGFNQRGTYAKRFWPKEGAGAGLAGIAMQLLEVNDINPHIRAELIGPQQTKVSLEGQGLLDWSHPSLELAALAESRDRVMSNVRRISFQLRITNFPFNWKEESE